MKNKIIFIFLILGMVSATIASANINIANEKNDTNVAESEYNFSDDYGVQWEMNFGPDWGYGARYEGPQPIGDCDNDGLNEMLVVGRDSKIRVFEWKEEQQTYLETQTLFCPLYPLLSSDAGGFAIGDLNGDGENEIAATWGTSVHKWNGYKYKTIAYNNMIFRKGGASGDCYIGDYDNDGDNELIVSGGSYLDLQTVPEIVIYNMVGFFLVKEAEWNNPATGYTYIYMPGLGDIDGDGKNELVVGSGNKVYVLDWNENDKKFDETVLVTTYGDDYPFACVLKDSDNDGKLEIHIGYSTPKLLIYEWDGSSYVLKYQKTWPGEDGIIEGLDVGNVDDDPGAEVCVGTNLVHVLGWNGTTYAEKAVLPTFGTLAVVSIGDCDNDGKNEIQAGSVMTDGEDFMEWVFKYGLEPGATGITGDSRIEVTVKGGKLGRLLKNASVAAQNLETGAWFDIQPRRGVYSTYTRNDLPESEYLLRVHMNGYHTQEANVTLISGQVTTYDFLLKEPLSYPSSINPIFYGLFFKFLERLFDA